MHCPACGQEMARQTLDGHYARRIDIDLCRGCCVLWFDPLESAALRPRGVLALFEAIHERRDEPHRPLPEHLACPRCRRPMARTSDVQRHGRFGYWSCPAEHGRLATFADFLREKSFVRPPSPGELAALRERVGTLACTSCGAPIDVARDACCRHCRSPIAILDPAQVERAIAELRDAGARRRPADVGSTPALEGASAARESPGLQRALDLVLHWLVDGAAAGSS